MPLWQADGGSLSTPQNQRIATAVEPLAEYLCFHDEAPLVAPIAGVGTFTEDFAGVYRGDHDRALRQFDLQTRLFRYPVSYLINSDTFAKLHPVLQSAIATAIWDRIDEASELGAVLSESGPQWLTAHRPEKTSASP